MPRSLVFLLTLVALVGHLCEVPALVDAVAHAHEAAEHSHESLDSCDAPLGISANPSACAGLDPGLDAAARSPLASAFSVPIAGAAPSAAEAPPPRRLPLFLLHASILI